MDISEHLKTLEMELLTSATRKSAERVAALLSDSFHEFGSSGRIYTKEDVILALQEETPVSIESADFKVMLLSEGAALVTYRSLKGAQGISPSAALRSSIWILDGENWRMIFHQGTKLP